MNLILASTSTYRAQILKKLGLHFEVSSPDIDESMLTDESPEAMVERLSISKSLEVGKHHEGLIIGSDQCAVHAGKVVGKPGDHKSARLQLQSFSGQSITFLTGLCLYNSKTESVQSLIEPYTVHFRKLSTAAINRYLHHEKPYDCAGSFKSEGLGISLFTALEGEDPNALIGLPLIKLITLLDNEGIETP